MTRAALVMACVSAGAAFGGAVIVTRATTSPQAVYIKRIAGAMAFAAALILAIFAYGLERMARNEGLSETVAVEPSARVAYLIRAYAHQRLS